MKINKFTILAIILFSSYFVQAQTIEVKVSDGLNNALAYALQGNATVIELVDDGGIYATTPVVINSPLTIRAKAGLTNKPVILIKGCKALPFIKIEHDLMFEGVIFDGYDAANAKYDSIQHVFSANAKAGAVNEKPNFTLKDCVVRNIYKFGDPATSTDGDIFDVTTGARVGDLLFENTTFMNSGDEAIRSINTHKAPVPVDGVFATKMTVKNCTFNNIRGSSIKIEGDGDSTNVDTQVLIEHCNFNASQRRVLWLRDLQNMVIKNLLITNLIQGNDKMDYVITFQGKGSTISHVDTFNVAIPNFVAGFLAEAGSWSGAKQTGTVDEATIYNLDPLFKDATNGDFTLLSASPVKNLASDGKALGDLRWAGTGTSVEDFETIPVEFALEQNYPNPFNPTTSIQFAITNSGKYSLRVFNLLGQEVANLIDSELNPGIHKVSFNGGDLSSGIYLYRLTGNNVNLTKKMILIK